MKKKSTILVLLLLISIVSFSQEPEDFLLGEFFKKDSVKILVTDSGLGGLSIAADLYERLITAGIFAKVDLVFFNAQPHLKSGYNSLKTRGQKVWAFNNALTSMEAKFCPDMILIGCNTLSVLYESTGYSKNTKIPVYGIVDAGIKLIEENINADSELIIFATKTTVSEGQHKRTLVADGFKADSIIMIPCPKLAGEIERGSNSAKTDSLINLYVKQGIDALQNSGKNDNLFVSYNCTHYGYADDLFRKAFNKHGIAVRDFLDPNLYMTDFLFTSKYLNRHESTEVSISVYSQAELTEAKLNSINELVKKASVETAAALLNYEFNPDYFKWKIEDPKTGL